MAYNYRGTNWDDLLYRSKGGGYAVKAVAARKGATVEGALKALGSPPSKYKGQISGVNPQSFAPELADGPSKPKVNALSNTLFDSDRKTKGTFPASGYKLQGDAEDPFAALKAYQPSADDLSAFENARTKAVGGYSYEAVKRAEQSAGAYVDPTAQRRAIEQAEASVARDTSQPTNDNWWDQMWDSAGEKKIFDPLGRDANPMDKFGYQLGRVGNAVGGVLDPLINADPTGALGAAAMVGGGVSTHGGAHFGMGDSGRPNNAPSDAAIAQQVASQTNPNDLPSIYPSNGGGYEQSGNPSTWPTNPTPPANSPVPPAQQYGPQPPSGDPSTWPTNVGGTTPSPTGSPSTWPTNTQPMGTDTGVTPPAPGTGVTPSSPLVTGGTATPGDNGHFDANGLWVPALLAGGSLVQAGTALWAGKTQADAAAYAAKLQYDAAIADQTLQKGMYDQTRTDLAPWRDAGVKALPGLENFERDNAQFKVDPFSFNMDARSPAYNKAYAFRLSEGMKALQNSYASRGGLLGGNAMKGITKYGQDMASQEVDNEFNRYNTSKTNDFNIFNAQRGSKLNALQSLAGVGQTAVTQMGNAGQNYANQAGQAGMNAANAQAGGVTGAASGNASGYVGAATALQNALTTGINYHGGQSANAAAMNLLKSKGY